jgi:hypothetical protein
MIFIPFINPLRFKEKGVVSEFQTRYFDQHHYKETILPFEENAEYSQPFQLSDQIVNYLESDETSATISIIRTDDDAVIISEAFAAISSTVRDGITYYTYLSNITAEAIGEGNFCAQIQAGEFTLESNPFCILEDQEGTVQIVYSHKKFYEDVLWELGDIEMQFRTQGYIKYSLPQRNSTTYDDQPMNLRMLKTVPYGSWAFITDAAGIPNYMIDILNRVFGCSNLFIDGKYFTVPADAKWELKEEDRYPLRGWGIDLRERDNKSSIDFKTGFLIREDGGFMLREDGGRFILG